MNNLVELAWYAALPVRVKATAELWEEKLRQVTKPIQESVARVAAEMGVSPSTARRMYDNWRKRGGMGLLPKYCLPHGQRGPGAEFWDWWKQLCEEQALSCRQAYMVFVRKFFSGEFIPGMEKESRNRLPRGYTYNNLMRNRPTEFELKAARVGLRAAESFMPLVRTTRVGMEVGQEIQMDDMWHDFQVIVLGQPEPVRLLALHALDVFSGKLVEMATKPRVWTGETRANLTEHEALFFVAHVLAEHGYHPDGTVLTMEGGTMTIRDQAVRDEIFNLSGQRVIVECGQGSNAPAHAGQYEGKSEGNFRRKAHLESFHNLLHNIEGNMRLFLGQTGGNARVDKPEQLHGAESEAKALVRYAERMALPEEVTKELQYGFLQWRHADLLVRRMVEVLNGRTDHELEGFEGAGLVTYDLEVPGMGLLPREEVERRLAVIEGQDAARAAAARSVMRPVARLMSPNEVHARGRGKLVRFTESQLARLLYRARRPEPVVVGSDHLVVIQDKGVSPDPLMYKALLLRPGEKYDAVLNPWRPERLNIFDAAGRWHGTLDIFGAASRVDTAAIEAQMKARAHDQKLLLSGTRRRAAGGVTAARLERTEGNVRAIRGHQEGEREALSEARAALMEIQ